MDGSDNFIVEDEKPSHLRAYLAVMATSILHFSTGAVMSWSSPMLPKLNLTSTEQTFVGSLFSLGAAPGPFVVTFCLDTIGRKGMAYVLWSTFMVSWILLLTTQNVIVIYIARLIGGIGVGGCCSGLSVFVSELAVTEIRGRLGSLSFTFIALGSLIVFGIGPYTSYYVLSVYGLAVGIAFLVLFYFVPESPYYYLRKGRKLEAKESLRKLRGYRSEEALDKEAAMIERAVFQDSQTAVSFWESIRTKAGLKAIGIGIFLVLMQQLSGGNPIGAFCQQIFETAHLNFPASTVPLVFTLSSLFGLVSVVIVNRWLTMKLALVISGFGITIFTGLVGLYFYLVNHGVDLYNYSYISVVLLFVSNLFVGLGVGPLVWPLVAEILPASLKGAGSGICGFISSLAGFVLITMFSEVAKNFGGYSTSFFGITVIMGVMTIASIFVVPDTSGKSLQEIQQLLSK